MNITHAEFLSKAKKLASEFSKDEETYRTTVLLEIMKGAGLGVGGPGSLDMASRKHMDIDKIATPQMRSKWAEILNKYTQSRIELQRQHASATLAECKESTGQEFQIYIDSQTGMARVQSSSQSPSSSIADETASKASKKLQQVALAFDTKHLLMKIFGAKPSPQYFDFVKSLPETSKVTDADASHHELVVRPREAT